METVMKVNPRTSSRIAALLCWLLFSGLIAFIIWGMRDRARLIRDRENEQIINTLLAGLRSYDDFGAAIESNSFLADRIRGFGIYDRNREGLYVWGAAPRHLDQGILEDRLRNRFGRYTIPDPKGRSVKFVLHFDRIMSPAPSQSPPPPGVGNAAVFGGEERRRPRQGFMGMGMSGGNYFYTDIFHRPYWRTMTITTVLFPLSSLALLALIFYIRGLWIRNGEYREKIEAQKNLVVLGAAASTLAHEIKNPLSSIRLQTGILAKTLRQEGQEEIRIINEEVVRLSALIYRVNDYLREAAGNPAPVDVRALLAETGRRLCGRDILDVSFDGGSFEALVYADPERLRSVFENVLRNALESGGDPSELGASVRGGETALGGKRSVLITLYDRGKGLEREDLAHVFDPFFTRKSAGTGIGLAISKRFVEAAGGLITLENREGGGAVLKIRLPLYSGYPGGGPPVVKAERGR
jgi:signal transduction histidine kinase